MNLPSLYRICIFSIVFCFSLTACSGTTKPIPVQNTSVPGGTTPPSTIPTKDIATIPTGVPEVQPPSVMTNMPLLNPTWTQTPAQETTFMKAIAIPDGKFQIVDQNAGKTVSMIDISPLQTTGQFAWSPDGKQLAFYANFYSLYIYSLETQEYRSIEEIKSLGFNGYMDWSPDGNWIAFGGGKDRSISKIYLIHPDGTGLHQLSPYYFHGYAQVTSWTSDGQYLLFSILKEAGSRKCFYDIWISDIDGKQPKLLAENIKCGLTDVAVSPDGKTIYYGVESGTYMSPIECYYENSCERIPSGSTFQFPDTWYKSFVPRWTGSYPTYYDVYPED